MIGIQLIRLQDMLPVNTIASMPGSSPKKVTLIGQDFRNVESVLINGITSPNFVVNSVTSITAEVPAIWLTATITDASVLSSQITMTARSLVQFMFGTRPKKASGITRLMQTFLRLLLRSPGSNIFHPRAGGGLLKRIGSNISDKATADIAIAVGNTKSYLLSVQSPERNIPPSERLLSAEITGVSADLQHTSISVTIVLTNHAGQRSAATMTT